MMYLLMKSDLSEQNTIFKYADNTTLVVPSTPTSTLVMTLITLKRGRLQRQNYRNCSMKASGWHCIFTSDYSYF